MEAGHQAASVSYRDVTKRYPGQTEPAINHLTLDVPAGDICVLVGAVRLREDHRDADGQQDGRDHGRRHPDRRHVRSGSRPDRAAAGNRLCDPAGGLFPHRSIAENIATVPKLLGWNVTAQGRALKSYSTSSGSSRRSPVAAAPAHRGTAAAGRRRPGARGRPADDADGRALRRARPNQPVRLQNELIRLQTESGRRSSSSPTTSTRRRGWAT